MSDVYLSDLRQTNKLRIDANFKNDLYNQCNTEILTSGCKKLADVYYAAVRAFGKKKGAEVLAAAQLAARDDLAAEVAQRAAEKA